MREKSSSLARHIRQEVAAEQSRQLKTLERVKQQELNTWREHVVAKKCQDYRTSMFQVGAAHRAAQAETEKAEKQKQQRAEQIQKCRRLATKRAALHKPTNILRSTATRGVNVQGRATAGTQTPVQLEKLHEGKENKLCNKQACKAAKAHSSCKRKRHKTRLSSNDRNENNHEEVMFEITSDSSSSISSDEQQSEPTANDANTGSAQLQKTPPVILDVDDDSEDSMEICSRNGIEINDLYMQSNRKFSRVVRPNASESGLHPPVAGGVAPDFDTMPSRPRFTQISDLVRRTDTNLEDTQRQTCEERVQRPKSPTRSSSRSPRKAASATSPAGSSNVSPTRSAMEPAHNRQQIPKRSSLRVNNTQGVPPVKVIDAGLRRSATSAKPSNAASANSGSTEKAEKPVTSVQQPRMNPTQQPQIQPIHIQKGPMDPMHVQYVHMQQVPPFMHPMYAPHMMPPYNMLPYPVPPYPMPTTGQGPGQSQLPVINSATSASANPSNTMTSHSTGTSKGQSGGTYTTGHVQFYDHNNKYRRNYKVPEENVQVNQHDGTQMNAMDNARIETQLRQLREQKQQSQRYY